MIRVDAAVNVQAHRSSAHRRLLEQRSRQVRLGRTPHRLSEEVRSSDHDELIEAGKVTRVIDRTYTLGETAEAIRYLEAGHAQGKVVITL
jgi:NADPH:quinone reductase-like Zn-dependent oxidoreductase